MNTIEELKQVVQKNCDLVDAVHAQDYGLCIYLLKMRDYYRWKKGISLFDELENEKIHAWIIDTEEYWEEIQGESFGQIPVNGSSVDPFETQEINSSLGQKKLIYGGGLGYGLIPFFYLADLLEEKELHGFKVNISGKEYARGIFGSPAMFKDDTIFIRKEALMQHLWARYDEWQFSRRNNSTKNAFGFYDFEDAPQRALKEITENEIDTVIQHEIGEGLLDKEFGEIWKEMLTEFAHTKTEILIRTTRDLAADCMTTLPMMLAENRIPSLHLYFAGFSDMRKELFPSLRQEFFASSDSEEFERLSKMVEKGKIYWYDLGTKVINLFKQQGKDSQDQIDELIEGTKL